MSKSEAVLPVKGPPGIAFTTLLVVLRKFPAVLASTFTLKMQLAFTPIDPPDKLIMFVPATAVIVPPPHPPDSPLGVATTSPAGSVSLKLVLAEPPAPVVMVNVRGVV